MRLCSDAVGGAEPLSSGEGLLPPQKQYFRPLAAALLACLIDRPLLIKS